MISTSFFLESSSPKHLKIAFRKFAEVFTIQGAPPVSMELVAHLPSVLTTPAVNFATGTAGILDNGNIIRLLTA
jgi:hypothetical protein